MRTTILILSVFLASCASGAYRPAKPGDVSVRASAGFNRSTLKATRYEPFLGQQVRVEEESSGPAVLGRLEVATTVEKNTDLGLYADLGHVDYADLAADQAALGLSVRQYLGELGTGVRPFLEARGGYRHSWVHEVSGGGFDVGGALGLELSTGRSSSIFLTVGYDRGTTDAGGTDTVFDGVAFTIGGSIRL
jgi:hypothetical protein